ncbi:hypothetical protein VD659_03850 [Herbiconiux sp. 11R-BC]|uniref:hypothetical protein n=1 Tax=Herbiconiux sp. 11R-BC TaxID=3111637 RepID=UPI003BFCEF79
MARLNRRSALLNTVLGSILTLTLVFGVAVSASAESATPPETPAPTSISDAPAPPFSDQPAVPDATMPAGDYSDFGDPAPAQMPTPEEASTTKIDPATLTDSQIIDRTEFDQTYRLPDCSNYTKMSTDPLNVLDDNGTYVPIETAVQTTGPWAWLGIGGGEVKLHPLEPKFAEIAQVVFTEAAIVKHRRHRSTSPK